MIEVLNILGNPNKEFQKSEKIYLNYFELGIDI
jgi:hypothetical protein